MQKSAFAVVVEEESVSVGHFVVDSKVLEKGVCSQLMGKHSQFAVTVVPRYS